MSQVYLNNICHVIILLFVLVDFSLLSKGYFRLVVTTEICDYVGNFSSW